MGGETEKELLKILEVAVDREKGAQDLYKKGARLAVKPEIKKMFQLLEAEERKHEELLTKEYHEVKKRLGLKILHPDE